MRRATILVMACVLVCCAQGRGGARPDDGVQNSPTSAQHEGPARALAAPDENTTPAADQGWSPTVDGLRGRLVATAETIPSTGQFEIALELENVGVRPRQVQVRNPFALVATLHDTAGGAVQPTSGRVDVIMSPRWETLSPSTSLRFVVSIMTEDGGAPAHLDLTTSLWRLSAGSYRLSAQYISSEFTAPAPTDGWNGTLALPPIDLTVR